MTSCRCWGLGTVWLPLSESGKRLMTAGTAPGATAWAGPLAGLRVLDLTRVLAGPFTTQILANLGAEVLKVERPGKGDDIRVMAPFAPGGESHYFLGLNNNKKSLVIDLKTARVWLSSRSSLPAATCWWRTFRPGVMEKFGLDFDTLHALNPRLVMCSISGFGRSGPLKDTPSFDIVTQAFSGAMSVNGDPPGGAPVKLGLPLGDMAGGVFGAPAILAALHERERTGRGRHIDISLMDGLMGMLGYQSQVYFITGKSPEPMGSAHAAIAPYGAFCSLRRPRHRGLPERHAFWHNFARALSVAKTCWTIRAMPTRPDAAVTAKNSTASSTPSWSRETQAHWDVVLERTRRSPCTDPLGGRRPRTPSRPGAQYGGDGAACDRRRRCVSSAAR